MLTLDLISALSFEIISELMIINICLIQFALCLIQDSN